MDGYLEGIVLKDRTAEYRSGSRTWLVEGQVAGLVRAAPGARFGRYASPA